MKSFWDKYASLSWFGPIHNGLTHIQVGVFKQNISVGPGVGLFFLKAPRAQISSSSGDPSVRSISSIFLIMRRSEGFFNLSKFLFFINNLIIITFFHVLHSSFFDDAYSCCFFFFISDNANFARSN